MVRLYSDAYGSGEGTLGLLVVSGGLSADDDEEDEAPGGDAG